MKQSILLIGALLLFSSCLTTAGTSLGTSEEHPDKNQVGSPGDPSDRLWPITRDDTLSLEVAGSESSTGTIRLIRSGQAVSSWSTGFPTRQFGMPLVIGPYPEQVIIVPFELGGGTGAGSYDWVSVRQAKGETFWKHMGLWAIWSHGKEEYDFSMSPYLLGSGRDLLFEFRYSQKTEEVTKVVEGRLSLEIRGKNGPVLTPVTLQDAMSLVQLLDGPLDGVRGWAGSIIHKCLPKDIGASLVRKGGKVDDGDRKAIVEALSNYFEKKEEGEP